MEIARDHTTGITTVVDDAGAMHTLLDTSGLASGTYPIYHYPGTPDCSLAPNQPGHVTYAPAMDGVLKRDPDRLYGRDGTVRGAVQVGQIAVP